MRVLLCQSYLGPATSEPLVLPIGLSYLASLIKDEHDVHCWDPNVSHDPMKELSTLLESLDPDVVGVSFRNVDSIFSFNKRSYYPPFVRLIKVIKQTAPSCKLVVGGAGFSIFSKEIMERNPEIDFGVVFEGERQFAELLKNIDHPERVGNVLFRRNGKFAFTRRSEPPDFDRLPWPSRDFFEIEKYAAHPLAIGVQSKRGCVFACAYCLHGFLVGNELRLRDPKKVVDEIEKMAENSDVKAFYFVDPVFNFPLDHARKICREMIRRKIDVRWEACFRPDFMNAKFVEEAVGAGCQLFDFSPDGASNEAMDALGKSLRVEDVERTLGLVGRMGDAKVAFEFMFDLPYDNTGHVLGLARLFPKIMLRCREKLRDLSLTKMRLYPHTRLYQIAIAQGRIREDTDLLSFPVHYESGSSRLLTHLLPHVMRLSSYSFVTAARKCHSLF